VTRDIPGEGGRVRVCSPLTLTLSPEGRGERRL
jgi:hypothetical protein